MKKTDLKILLFFKKLFIQVKKMKFIKLAELCFI